MMDDGLHNGYRPAERQCYMDWLESLNALRYGDWGGRFHYLTMSETPVSYWVVMYNKTTDTWMAEHMFHGNTGHHYGSTPAEALKTLLTVEAEALTVPKKQRDEEALKALLQRCDADAVDREAFQYEAAVRLEKRHHWQD